MLIMLKNLRFHLPMWQICDFYRFWCCNSTSKIDPNRKIVSTNWNVITLFIIMKSMSYHHQQPSMTTSNFRYGSFFYRPEATPAVRNVFCQNAPPKYTNYLITNLVWKWRARIWFSLVFSCKDRYAFTYNNPIFMILPFESWASSNLFQNI